MEQPIILFDGVCNLCNYFVQIVIKRDKKDLFLFASQQSTQGRILMADYNVPLTKDGNIGDTVLLISNIRLYDKSDAVIEIGCLLGGWYKVMAYGMKLLPRVFRNGLYKYIAAHRYQWFGLQNQCMIPTPKLKAKFLS